MLCSKPANVVHFWDINVPQRQCFEQKFVDVDDF